MTDDWEREAANWIAWARTPGHDSYWYYREPFFDEVVPAPGRRTLDVGCGEGRVTRDLTARAHRVVGVDTSPTLLTAAREADPDGEYLLADAAALPFADGEFDLVVLLNMIPFFEELARVAAPAGTVVFAFSAGAETPIYVPPETLRARLAPLGFTDFDDVAAGAGTAFVAQRSGVTSASTSAAR